MTLLLSSSPKLANKKYSATGVRASVSPRQGSTAQTAHFVQALHDHLHSDDTDESCLFFRKGAIIEVVARDASGWWDGLCDGQRGWFPSSFVGRIGEAVRARADNDEMPRKGLDAWQNKRATANPSQTFSTPMPKQKRASPLSSLASSSKKCQWQESMEDVLRLTREIVKACQSSADFDFQGTTFNLITAIRYLLEESPAEKEELQPKRDAILKALDVVSRRTAEKDTKTTDKMAILSSVNQLAIEVTSFEEALRTSTTTQRTRPLPPLRDSKLSIDGMDQMTLKLLDHQARIDDLAVMMMVTLQHTSSTRHSKQTDEPSPITAVQQAKDAVHNAINDLASAFKGTPPEPSHVHTSCDTKLPLSSSSHISTFTSSNATPTSIISKDLLTPASMSESIGLSLFGSINSIRPREGSLPQFSSIASSPATHSEGSQETPNRPQRTVSAAAVTSPTMTQETSTLAQQYQRSAPKFSASQPTISPSIIMTGSKSTPSRPEVNTNKPTRKTSVPSMRPTPSTSEKSTGSNASTDMSRKHILLTTLRQLQHRRSKKSLRRKKSKELPTHLKERAYSEDELIPTDEGQIRGATIQVLIDRLTSHDVYLDHLAEPSFFYSFRHFSDPTQVANLLIDRFCLVASDTLTSEELESWRTHVQLPVQQKVLHLIRVWFKRHYNQAMDQEAQKALLTFVKSPNVEQVITKTEAQQLARKIEKATEIQSISITPLCKTKSSSSVPDVRSLGKENLSPHARTPVYRRVNPTKLAEQLTLMDSAMFCQITANELMNHKKKKNLSEEVWSVKALVQRSSQITEWILSMLRKEKDHKRRVLIVEFWVKVAEHCLSLNNLNTLMSICTALNSSSFLRQSGAWEEVIRSWKHKKTIEMIQNFTNFDRNFAKYRKCLKEVDPDKPCIPFLGIFLKDMVALDEGTPSQCVSNGGVQLINFEKYTRMTKALEESVLRAQIPYPLVDAQDIQQYLLQCITDVQIEQEIESDIARSKSLDLERLPSSLSSERASNKPKA